MSRVAMYTALSGLTAHARRLDVIGNNIANATTTAFKSSRMLFADQFSWALDPGQPPGGTAVGGSNPKQVGLGVQIAATQRDFRGGSMTITGDPRDLAIDGRGFFVVDQGGEQRFTRAGSFRQDSDFRLVTPSGDPVMGYGVDANFNIVPGALTPLTAPINRLSIAQATRNVELRGTLKSDGIVATRGSRTELGATPQTGLTLLPGATPPPGPGNVIEETSLLTQIADPSAAGAALFAAGQRVEIAGARRGKDALDTAVLEVGVATTVRQLMDFLRDALGINPAAGVNPDGSTPGVSLDPAAGRLAIVGNTGTINDLKVDTANIRLVDAGGALVRNPLSSTKTIEATGESARTSLVVYDSLGAPVGVQVGMVLESRGAGGTTWRYEVDSRDNPELSTLVRFGRVSFDNTGQVEGTGAIDIDLDRSAAGAASPQRVSLNLTDGQSGLTATAQPSSMIFAQGQDGARAGVLRSFGINEDGVIEGSFDNGVRRALGQVVLATFANQEGLIAEGDSVFRVGANSGPPQIFTAGAGRGSTIRSGQLEQSNVDISQEFIDMMLTSTGYSASSRVIRTADEMLQQLLVLSR